MMRWALKCLPRPAAARVFLGELLRLPAHPRAIGAAVVQVTRELATILRLRQHQRQLGPLVVQVIEDRAPLPASEREPPTPPIG
jgi:hypothetical protein